MSAPREQTERVIAGEGTRADIAAMERWADSADNQHPDLSADLAAAVSLINAPMDTWQHVHFDPRPDGEPWTMTVTSPSGTEVVDIPGGGAPETEGASEMLEELETEQIDYDTEYESTA
jgi:hypothetical protein